MLGSFQPRVFFDQSPNRVFARDPDNTRYFLTLFEEYAGLGRGDSQRRGPNKLTMIIFTFFQWSLT
jgi:hypothetical protein